MRLIIAVALLLLLVVLATQRSQPNDVFTGKSEGSLTELINERQPNAAVNSGLDDFVERTR